MERSSKNRQAILECLRGTTIHPTAEWVYRQLKPDFPSLSLATVYRNILQLKNSGSICSMGVLAGQEHFDARTEPHAHVMCSHCGKIQDLPVDASLLKETSEIEILTGFKDLAQLYVGYCPDCRQHNTHSGEE